MRIGRRPATLTGRVANCGIWIPNGRTGWKCGKYAPVCEPPTCKKNPVPGIKQIRVCSDTQKVFSAFYGKLVTRCKKYQAACETAACMPFPMPYPTEEPEPTPDPTEVKSIAEWMAQQANVETFEKEPYLAREILSRGGIRPPRGPAAEREEYRAIPLFLRNKTGLSLDEIASEMGYDYSNDLREDIAKVYPPKAKGAWKKKRSKNWTDFEKVAYQYIEGQMEEGVW